jgi:superfamily II DNA or RNA helicase
MQFDISNIANQFDPRTFQRGEGYAREARVLTLRRDGNTIDSTVRGSGGAVYHQSISMYRSGRELEVDGSCSCPMEYNCKHVVAALLTALRDSPAEPAAAALPYAALAWLKELGEAAAVRPEPARKSARVERLIYVLVPDHATGLAHLCLCKARMGKDGSVVSASVFNDAYDLLNRPPAHMDSTDRLAVPLFVAMSRSGVFSKTVAELRDEAGAHLLQILTNSGRLGVAADRACLKTGAIDWLEPGPSRCGAPAWLARGDAGASLQLHWRFQEGEPIDFVLATAPPIYVRNKLFGELELVPCMPAVPLRKLNMLVASAPTLAPEHAVAMARELELDGWAPLAPPPELAKVQIRARPLLMLGSLERQGNGAGVDDYALLVFDYAGVRVSIDPSHEADRTSAGGPPLVRDLAFEAAAAAQLGALGFVGPAGDSELAAIHGMHQLKDNDAWRHFYRHQLPGLKQDGWLVELGPGFRFDVEEVQHWQAEIEEDAGQAWFDLALHIVVNDQRVALLPLLLELIRQAPQDFDAAALAAHADDERLVARLPDGSKVGLPWGRIRPILEVLGELYFVERLGDSLRLRWLDAARLAELEAQAQLRWLGAETLRALGRKLRDFGGVQAVPAPAGLQADLRPYQAEGLAWMQFLREYKLAGILADDMGLGKTIQTLSHIQTEKEAGRLTAPALVVAPTSLMGNWMAEAARFTPGLRVLLLHGAERAAQFAGIGDYDLVLTTYPLLVRDEMQLRAHQYHLLVLDESQYIKNSRSKAAQAAGMLKANHRLCLTGTPLQNHLGEMWSQFHFLMPGFLGDEKRFNSDFRKPIEKLADTGRNAFLVRRIRPFVLRRTKDLVATELPPKTEIVREIELGGMQLDMYETLRLAMDKKVREAIADKGVARSQIIILDALLKLRQVCCDPRLVKLAGYKGRNVPSAKLDALMEMITTLLEEGRKILVFSQFTSMLELIEEQLRERGIGYALLTGDTLDRSAQVAAFQGGAVPLFLISLKAGGVGLNLTAADTVIHYDPWWNPAAENQASDRAWRIGQDKPVFVYKLIAKGTLEHKIQELQRKKAELAAAVLSGDAAPVMTLTQEDLQAILAPL